MNTLQTSNIYRRAHIVHLLLTTKISLIGGGVHLGTVWHFRGHKSEPILRWCSCGVRSSTAVAQMHKVLLWWCSVMVVVYCGKWELRFHSAFTIWNRYSAMWREEQVASWEFFGTHYMATAKLGLRIGTGRLVYYFVRSLHNILVPDAVPSSGRYQGTSSAAPTLPVIWGSSWSKRTSSVRIGCHRVPIGHPVVTYGWHIDKGLDCEWFIVVLWKYSKIMYNKIMYKIR